MAYSERLPRIGLLAEVIGRIVEAARPRVGFAAGRRPHAASRDQQGSLEARTLWDIGARREDQDYAASATAAAGSERRLHLIADRARWSSLR